LVAVLLDVRQAYDKIGHAQETMAMNAQPLPSKLRSLALNLDVGNCTQIRTKEGTTKKIQFNCGILQGAPTSPQKFNASTKIILDELSEIEICRKYGYRINNDIEPITCLAFADDTGNLGNSRESASFLVYETSKNFNRIGLDINFEKSVAIIIEDGKLSTDDLVVDENITIRALGTNETIKYLGVTFADDITLNHQEIIQDLNEKLNRIVSTVTLRPDQKLKIINMYIFPTLVYPFQTAPLAKLTKKFLEDVDKLIRHAVKEILNLPDDTPTSMLYSSNSMKGLSIIRAEWEAFIQNINTVTALIKVNHPIISSVRNLDNDIKTCLTKLKLPHDFLDNAKNQKIKYSELLRSELRQREYIEWQRLRSKGKGVELFQDCPKINRLLFEKHSITTSEWINYFKMVGNVAAVRNIPGRSSGTNRCRIESCNEIETLPHVLGFCHQGELLRLQRHHKVVQLLGKTLRKKKWTVVEEFACLSVDGSNRRVDLLVYDEVTRNGFILDPTIRFEINQNQPEEVNQEKKSIYEPCIPDIQAKCKLKNIEVIGLLLGARATIPKFFTDFCKRFKIEKTVIEEIGIEVLRGSSRILSNHLYDPQRC